MQKQNYLWRFTRKIKQFMKDNNIKTGIQYNLVKIAKYYNDAYLFGLASEESAELIQALNKLNRYALVNEYNGNLAELEDNLYEEIADVEVLLQMIKNRYQCEEQVYKWKCEKVNRWLKRLCIETS